MTIKLYSDTPLQHPTVHKLVDKYHTHSHRNKGYTNNFVLGHYTAIKTGLCCVRASGKEGFAIVLSCLCFGATIHQSLPEGVSILRSTHLHLQTLSRFGLAVRRWAGKQSDLGSNLLQLSFLFKSCGLWTLSCDLSLTINETLKRLSSLPILMQESFWL